MLNVNVASLILHPSDITAANLTAAARRQGVLSLGIMPFTDRPDWTSKLLLASLVDVTRRETVSELVELNRAGCISLGRVDLEAMVPVDRRGLWQASCFRHMGARFDSLIVPNRSLYFSAVR